MLNGTTLEAGEWYAKVLLVFSVLFLGRALHIVCVSVYRCTRVCVRTFFGCVFV